MSSNDLTKKTRELKELKIMADELQAEITALEDEIKAHMTAQDITEMVVDVYKIRWTPVTSKRLDTKAIQSELPDIAARYTKTTTARRFQIA